MINSFHPCHIAHSSLLEMDGIEKKGIIGEPSHSSWTVIYHCWTIESAKLVVHFVRVETQLESSVNHRQQLFINKELIPKCSVYFFILPAYMGAAERKLMNHDGYPSDKNECELKGEKIFFQEALFNFHHQSPIHTSRSRFFASSLHLASSKKYFMVRSE